MGKFLISAGVLLVIAGYSWSSAKNSCRSDICREISTSRVHTGVSIFPS